MKNLTEEQLRSCRPSMDAIVAIQFCLDNLFSDNERSSLDIAAGNCNYEEIIGALLLAEDKLKELRSE